MEIKEAKKLLYQEIIKTEALAGVGIGNKILRVYARTPETGLLFNTEYANGFEGFEVEVIVSAPRAR